MNIKESETVELKRSTSQLKKDIISIVSILNKHQKGTLYFGLNDDGTVQGQLITEKTLRDISQAVSSYIEPKIYPAIEKVILEGIECIAIEFSGSETPYFAYGRAYMRVGDEDKQLSLQELEKLILRKSRDELRWDTVPCKKAGIYDISEEKLKSFLEHSGLQYDSIENTLEKLSLISDGSPLNAAIMLFGKEPQRFFPNARLRCAVFGTTTTSFTIDMQDFEGDLFYLIEKAEAYILKNIHIGMKLDGLRRIDVPEINRDAFREAIINAFCHRDYREYDSVNIAVFKDRVEVRNPGSPFGGLTIEQITKENVSKRRNELIAEIFHRVQYVERWGRGIELILDKEPDTSFKIIAGIFVSTFKRKDTQDKVKHTERWSEKWSEKWSDLHETQYLIVEYMAQNPMISRKEISARLGINQSAVQKHIEKLKKKGVIERVGPAKGGRWEIISEK